MSWEEIDEFWTLPRLYAMNKYWRDHPPVHILLAAFIGVKPKQEIEQEEENLDEIVSQFAMAGLKRE